MKRFTKSSQASESATRFRDLGCSLGNMWPEMAMLRGSRPGKGSAVQKILSEAELCLSNRPGHQVHYFALRGLDVGQFRPALIRWSLESKRLEIIVDSKTFIAHHHNPIEIARTQMIDGCSGFSFDDAKGFIRCEFPGGAFKYFSVSFPELDPCLDYIDSVRPAELDI